MSYKEIAKLIPTIQAASLVSENLKASKKKKQGLKSMVGLGTKNVVGVSLIKVNADLIGDL